MEINLQELQREKNEISEFLARPEAFSETGFAEKSRRLNEVTEILELTQALKRAEDNLAAAEEMRGDAELAEMAENDIIKYSEEKTRLEAELEEKLLPKDPDDEKPAIVEIRAGAGGDEASLFAGELYRMYLHYAEKNGLKTEQISINENEVGGVKEVICRISGDDAYGKMKFEGGVHRVQRVPVTESQGRIHTSTATVAVLPEMEEKDLEINPDDLRIDIYRSGGHGGQGVNTTDSAVRITHLPTGIVVAMQDERSQQQNRVKAMTILRARLAEKKKEEEMREASAERKSLIGTGDRSEKIRTYNFPQDRVTDHRIHYSRSNITAVMNGEIEDIVGELKKSEREMRKNEV